LGVLSTVLGITNDVMEGPKACAGFDAGQIISIQFLSWEFHGIRVVWGGCFDESPVWISASELAAKLKGSARPFCRNATLASW
jgi:hypothetical protein